MKALVVGMGGIGSNVYAPQLKQLGYAVDSVDPVAPATFKSVAHLDSNYDVAVVCTPNYTHFDLAAAIAPRCAVVFVDKPGVANSERWQQLIAEYPQTRFIMCKNNLYRQHSPFANLDLDDVYALEINWINADRVPSPGSWFTNRSLAWGGVKHDLFPHLYCHLVKIAPNATLERLSSSKARRWELAQLGATAYGVVNSDGVYDVEDFAQETWLINNRIPVTLTANWRGGIDKQNILVYSKDTVQEWRYGLCPDDAYGRMIATAVNEPYSYHTNLDTWIHKNLEI